MTTAARVECLTRASEWLLRLNEPARSERDIDEWVEWCAESPENLEAFERLQRDWHDLDALKSSSTTALQGGGGRGAMGSSFFSWRLAASFAAVALTAGLAIYFWPSLISVNQVAASTTNKSATLPDGSSVVLGARTKVDIDFTGEGRDLNLSQGEAYFQVRKDHNRPFVVHAGEVSVIAVGTAFNVRRTADRIVVTVEEGTIELSSSSPLLPRGGEGQGEEGLSPTWRAQAGHQLTYFLSTRTTTLAAVDPAMFLKWRDGELAYMWEPLGAVIADVNRYSPRHIVLEDQSLNSFRFTGTVFTDAIDEWLEAIQGAYPMRVEYSPAGEVRLHSTAPVQKLP